MTEQTKKKSLSEEQRRRNRQINYFIMRYMWQVVRGKRAAGDREDTIYAEFDMSRRRYERVLKEGNIGYRSGEVDKLARKTGLRKELFTGDIRFRCPYTVMEDNKRVEKEISKGQWDKLFEWRHNNKEQLRTLAKRGSETIQNQILDILDYVNRTDKDNTDFYNLCYYLKELRPAMGEQADLTVREVERVLKELTFEFLDECQMGQLGKLRKLLKEKQELVTHIYVYKDEKQK